MEERLAPTNLITILFALSLSIQLPAVNSQHIRELDFGVQSGESLKGTSVRGLQHGHYSIQTSGAVENYSKWPLIVMNNECAEGIVTTPLRNIHQATREGFSSRHSSDTATGVWMRHSLVVDDDLLVHFMYTAPYSFDWHANWLAVGACLRHDFTCLHMDASKMYYNKYPFISKKEFYRNLEPVTKCFDNLCITGFMASGHRPIMLIKVLPKSFYDLSASVRDKLENLTKKEYEAFIKSMVDQ